MSEKINQVIKSINSGKNYPAVDLVQKNPELAALVSKLTRSRDRTESQIINSDGNSAIDQSQMLGISDKIKTKRKDNENIIQLFPDIELGIQILVSSILSPKDMVKTELIYKLKDSIFPSEITMGLHDIVRKHLENHYDLLKDLPVLLRESLFGTGSYIKTVIPESILDDIIHQRTISKESLNLASESGFAQISKSIGILGGYEQDKRIGLESIFTGSKPAASSGALFQRLNGNVSVFDDKINITDSMELLKFSKLKESVRKKAIRKLAVESNRLDNTIMTNIMFGEPTGKSQNLLVVPDKGSSSRKSIGRPLTMKMPSEAVIPVYIPGDETKHIGYFVLIDSSGYPVSANSNLQGTQSLSSLWQQANQGGSSSGLIQKARQNLIAGNCNDTNNLDQIVRIYGSIVETNLVNRLRNGVYESEYEISENEEVYRIMLARSLAGKFTTMVYIPEEFMTYFAFKYHPNGTGKSLLDDLKIITSIRSILLFARVMALTKSAINLTHVNMNLDPNDPDPEKTIEMGMHEVLKMRQNYLPLGINTPTDLVDWINRAGFEFTFDGHPGIPQTKFEFESRNIQHQVPDDSLDESLRKQTYMAFGISPETIDNGFNSEFATTVVSNNILLSKRVSQYQDILCRQLVDYVQKLLSCDEVFKKEALDFLKENKGLMEKTFSAQEVKDLDEDTEDGNLLYAIEKYLEYLDIELPKPDETSVDTQLEAYTKYEEALDKAITSWISPDIITSDVSGEISSYADTIKNIVRAHYLRQWMSDNNFLSELGDMVTKDEDGKANMDVFDINKAHIEGLVKMSVRFIDSMKSVKAAADKDIQNLGTEPAQSGGDGSQSGDDGGSQDGGAQGGGMDDFSLDGEDDMSAQDGAAQDGGTQDGEEAQPAQEPPAQ
jgi:hypothetical protein